MNGLMSAGASHAHDPEHPFPRLPIRHPTPTFDVDPARPEEFLVRHTLGRAGVEQDRRRVDEDIFVDSDSSICDPARRLELVARHRLPREGEVLPDSDLIDEGRGEKLSEDFELRGTGRSECVKRSYQLESILVASNHVSPFPKQRRGTKLT